MLTCYEKNQKERRNFADPFKNQSEEFWDTVIWSDESAIILNKKYNRTYWHFKEIPHNPDYFIETEKFPKKIMIWACFSSKGKADIY